MHRFFKALLKYHFGNMCNDLRCFSKENVKIRTTKVSLFYLHFKPSFLHELYFVKKKKERYIITLEQFLIIRITTNDFYSSRIIVRSTATPTTEHVTSNISFKFRFWRIFSSSCRLYVTPAISFTVHRLIFSLLNIACM